MVSCGLFFSHLVCLARNQQINEPPWCNQAVNRRRHWLNEHSTHGKQENRCHMFTSLSWSSRIQRPSIPTPLFVSRLTLEAIGQTWQAPVLIALLLGLTAFLHVHVGIAIVNIDTGNRTLLTIWELQSTSQVERSSARRIKLTLEERTLVPGNPIDWLSLLESR